MLVFSVRLTSTSVCRIRVCTTLHALRVSTRTNASACQDTMDPNVALISTSVQQNPVAMSSTAGATKASPRTLATVLLPGANQRVTLVLTVKLTSMNVRQVLAKIMANAQNCWQLTGASVSWVLPAKTVPLTRTSAHPSHAKMGRHALRLQSTLTSAPVQRDIPTQGVPTTSMSVIRLLA